MGEGVNKLEQGPGLPTLLAAPCGPMARGTSIGGSLSRVPRKKNSRGEIILMTKKKDDLKN